MRYRRSASSVPNRIVSIARSGIEAETLRSDEREAVLDQRHQRGELVRRRAQPGLEDRDHTLPEEQGIDGFTLHGAASMSPLSGTTAPPHYREGEGHCG
jgi:hypothetical protein